MEIPLEHVTFLPLTNYVVDRRNKVVVLQQKQNRFGYSNSKSSLFLTRNILGIEFLENTRHWKEFFVSHNISLVAYNKLINPKKEVMGRL